MLYGGAAGGGKSDALLVIDLRFIHNPHFRSLLLRREKPDLREMIDRSKVLYPEIGIDPSWWNESRLRWEMPWGAFMQFGAAEHEDDILAFKSFQYPIIKFDELTTFTEKQYLFMLSRNRVPKGSGLPLWIRSATNPGDIGQLWVQERWHLGDPDAPQPGDWEPYKVYTVKVKIPGLGSIPMTRQYIPATVFDNPKLEDREQYIAGMASMGPELAEAMLWGKWGRFPDQFFPALPREVEPKLEDRDYYIIRCMDYGIADPTVVYWLIVYPRLEKVQIADELLVENAHDPVGELATAIPLRERLLELQYGVKKRAAASVAGKDIFRRKSDGSQGVADMLMRRGVWFEQANDDRVAGWSMLKLLIHSGRLETWRGRAPYLRKTLPTLKRDPNKPSDIKPKGQPDHGADALRYGVVAYFEGSVPAAAPPAPDPLLQDTYLPQLLKKIEQEGKRDPFLEAAGGLL